MKRWIAIIAAIILTLLLAACGGDNSTQHASAPAEPSAQMHTVAPAAEPNEPEWAHIDREMTLEDRDNLYAKGSDFVCFTLVGSDDSAEIRFRLDDVTAGMLRAQSPDNEYYVTMDGERIGGARLNEDCDELTLTGDFTYRKLCELANRIRGLE